jgi:hypothetical protein
MIRIRIRLPEEQHIFKSSRENGQSCLNFKYCSLCTFPCLTSSSSSLDRYPPEIEKNLIRIRLKRRKDPQPKNMTLKVHKNENFFGFDFEFCTVSLLVMSKY